MGPVLNQFASSSVDGIRKLCDGGIPFVPALHFPYVDVRDIAQAHLNVLIAEAGSLDGERIIIAQESYWFKEMLQHISDKFKDKGLTGVATKEVGYKTLWAASLFDK